MSVQMTHKIISAPATIDCLGFRGALGLCGTIINPHKLSMDMTNNPQNPSMHITNETFNNGNPIYRICQTISINANITPNAEATRILFNTFCIPDTCISPPAAAFLRMAINLMIM